MMSTAEIHRINREIAEEIRQDLAENGEESRYAPAVFDSYDLNTMKYGNTEPLSSIPNIGYYVPNGWERVNIEEDMPTRKVVHEGFGAYLVDKTGFGSAREPALTISEFMGVIRKGYGYAMVEEGEFQVQIGVFRKT